MKHAEPFEPHPDVGEVYEQAGGYCVDKPVKRRGKNVQSEQEQLTNWVWKPTINLRWPSGGTGERGVLEVNGAKVKELDLPASAWNSRKEILDYLGTYGAVCFTTNSADVAKIRQKVVVDARELPVAIGVNSYGLHKRGGEWVALYADETLCESPNPPVFYAGVPDMTGGDMFKSPQKHDEDELEEARTAIRGALGLLSFDSSMALLGYGMSACFGPRLTNLTKGKLPFLYVEGERESGKSSFAEIVLRLFFGDYTARLHKATKMTPYQYETAYCGANNMIAVLDEYKQGEVEFIDSYLRKHHDLARRRKGTGTSGHDELWEYNAPLIVLGEGFSDDPATRSRGVIYFPTKKERGSLSAYSQVAAAPLEAYAHHAHQMARTMTDEQVLEQFSAAQTLAKAALEPSNSPRLEFALSYISFGLLSLQKDVGGDGFGNDHIIAVLASGADNFLEGGAEAKTNLERFLEELASCLSTVPKTAIDNYITPSAQPYHLIIRATPAVELIKRVKRGTPAIGNAAIFNRATRDAPFFAEGEMHKAYGGKACRGQKLDLQAIPGKCDAGLLVKFYEDLLSELDRQQSNDR